MITLFQKLVANRRRIFTFLGAYKGDNALLTVHDYNDLIDQLNYNAGRKVAVSVLKPFTGIEPPAGVYARLLSSGGGCLVGGSGCVAGTVTLDKYKAAKGASLVRDAVGEYHVDLQTDGFGEYAHISVEISALSRVGFVKQTPVYSESINPKIIGYQIKCYNADSELDDLPLVDAIMTTTYYAKFLSPVNEI